MVSPIATFSKHGNRAYPKNVVKNTYKRGYRLKLRLLKTWLYVGYSRIFVNVAKKDAVIACVCCRNIPNFILLHHKINNNKFTLQIYNFGY